MVLWTKKSKVIPLIFFNASVILAGLKSPKGASASILYLVQKRKAKGIISEIVIDEVLRHVKKMELDQIIVNKTIHDFFKIVKAPDEIVVNKFKKIIIDLGDAHILASAFETQTHFLVTLDKKHLLVLKDRVRKFNIVSPGDLVNRIKKSKNNNIT